MFSGGFSHLFAAPIRDACNIRKIDSSGRADLKLKICAKFWAAKPYVVLWLIWSVLDHFLASERDPLFRAPKSATVTHIELPELPEARAVRNIRKIQLRDAALCVTFENSASEMPRCA